MPVFDILIFSGANVDNPQNPGNLPSEDGTFLSDLDVGQQITWLGGAENVVVSVNDVDDTFDEALNNQTLASDVTFGGTTFTTGQIVTPTYTIEFTGSDGNTYTLTSFNFDANTNGQIPDAVFWEGDIPPAGTVLTVANEINPTRASAREYSDTAVCFAAGTRILTPQGERNIETLVIGDFVKTFDGEMTEIKWIGVRDISESELRDHPKLLPIRITSGALGNGFPNADLVVSPQHRLMANSKISKRMFGQDQVLVAANKLTTLPGIFVDTSVKTVQYFHILLETHEILCANGAPAESLYLGEQALKSITTDGLAELRKIFPSILRPDFRAQTTQFIPKGKMQKKLIERHHQNGKPFFKRSLGRGDDPTAQMHV
ncbi:Hint domain-containing protein [Tateyamaria sp.]|uniref:Hint domain-containing protein n=1 Tax=Tateyamaria sp. TaxID=1929288 RepID=UPI00329C4068